MSMDQYMGYQAGRAAQSQETLLPQINIAGILFHADVVRLELREVGNPANRMPMIGAKEEMGFSHFFFDTRTKNLYAGDSKMPVGIPSHVQLILLPPLKELDPVGLARKQGLSDNHYGRKRETALQLSSIARKTKEESRTGKTKGRKM